MRKIVAVWVVLGVIDVIFSWMRASGEITTAQYIWLLVPVGFAALIVMSTWLVRAEAEAKRLREALPKLNQLALRTSLPPLVASEHLYQEEKARIDAQFDLWVEMHQNAGRD